MSDGSERPRTALAIHIVLTDMDEVKALVAWTEAQMTLLRFLETDADYTDMGTLREAAAQALNELDNILVKLKAAQAAKGG